MNKKQLGSSLVLLFVALIWGVAFVAQDVGMDYVGPFTFNAARTLLGGIVLIPCIALLDRLDPARKEAAKKGSKKQLLIGGVCCGLMLYLGSTFQQIGIMYTTVGKAGFITALYILFVPLMGLFVKKRPPILTWIAVAVAMVGLYLLCMNESFTFALGDILMLICAVAFAGHILVIDRFTALVDGVRLSCVQFFVCSLLSWISVLVSGETVSLESIGAAWLPIGYAGILSCSVAYTLQIVAQKNAKPEVASLLMSFESVFAVIAGWILLSQALSLKEVIGCALMFAAIVFAQLPQKKKA